MGLTLQEVLVKALKKLEDPSFQRFLEELSVWEVRDQYTNISDELKGKNREDVAGLIIKYFNTSYGAEVTLDVLEVINEKNVWEELQRDLREVDISGLGLGTSLLTDKVHFTDDHRSELIVRITDVDPVLNDLRDQNLLTHEQYEDLMRRTTTQEKMRELCDIIHHWEDAGKYSAYTVIQNHNKDVIEDLEEEEWRKKNPWPFACGRDHFVNRQRLKLMKYITEVNAVIDDLCSHHLLTRRQSTDLQAMARSEDKMKLLLEIFQDESESVKDQFYISLWRHNYKVINHLEKTVNRSAASSLIRYEGSFPRMFAPQGASFDDYSWSWISSDTKNVTILGKLQLDPRKGKEGILQDQKSMELKLREVLVKALKTLKDSSFHRFKQYLGVWEVRKQYENIPTYELQGNDPEQVAGLIVDYYRFAYGAEVTLQILEDINETKVREELQHDLGEVDISGLGLGTSLFTDRVNFIDNHRSDLIAMVTDVHIVLYNLCSQNLLTDEQIKSVMERTSSLQKMMQLCDIIRQKTDIEKYSAYKIFKKYNYKRIKYLEDEDRMRRNPVAQYRMRRNPVAQYRMRRNTLAHDRIRRNPVAHDWAATQHPKAPPMRSCKEMPVDDISCKFCGKQVKDLEACLVDPIACGGLYKLELKSPGLYFCPKTGIKFQVEAPVTIEYKLDSWSDHLKDLSYTSYEILSPLFNIQTHGEPNAVSAVYLPHYLCLKGFSGDISLIKCAHFKDGNLTLETPTQIEPFYVLLKNPTFSCLGLLTALGKKKTPKHGIVLLYFKILCRGDPNEEYKIHLYTVPYTVNVEESLDQENKKFGFQRVKKYEHTNDAIYTKSKYLITGHPGVLAHPKTLKFDIEPYQFTEIRLKEKTADIFLYVAEEKTQDTVWDTRLTQNDLMDVAQLLSSLTIHRDLPSPSVSSDMGRWNEPQQLIHKVETKQSYRAATPRTEEQPREGACALYPEHFLDKHRDALIQRVSDMGQILDHLLKHKLLTQEQYDNIRSIRPRQEAMRQLYGYMTIWGHCDKEKFYQALKMYNEPLVRDLEDKDTIKM
ncbi:uncharacterized protein [Engystomops pustulosus]|uniref:uncharacterized protein isoform X2 n=1 Tax=Engystomops pustulosus TaxID=76066 RepID=UPI003AFAAA3F